MRRNQGLGWRLLAAGVIAGLAMTLPAMAQAETGKAKVLKVQAQKVRTPFYNNVDVDSRAAITSDWLVLLMDYQTFGGTGKGSDGKAGWHDEVTVEWNVLIPRKEGRDLLLRKKVTYIDVEDKKTLHVSDLYLRPGFFKRQMKGVRANDIRYYVLVKVNGQTEAKFRSDREASKWWEWEPPKVQVVDELMTRDQTPFAPVDYDFFEQVKPQAAGR